MIRKKPFPNPLTNGAETLVYLEKIDSFKIITKEARSKLDEKIVYGKRTGLYKKLMRLKRIWNKR